MSSEKHPLIGIPEQGELNHWVVTYDRAYISDAEFNHLRNNKWMILEDIESARGVSLFDIGGKKYILKYRRMNDVGIDTESNDSETEYEVAKLLHSRTIRQGFITASWERPVALLNATNGLSAVLFEYVPHDKLSIRGIVEHLIVFAQSHQFEFRDDSFSSLSDERKRHIEGGLLFLGAKYLLSLVSQRHFFSDNNRGDALWKINNGITITGFDSEHVSSWGYEQGYDPMLASSKNLLSVPPLGLITSITGHDWTKADEAYFYHIRNRFLEHIPRT